MHQIQSEEKLLSSRSVRSISLTNDDWNKIDSYVKDNYMKQSSFIKMLLDKFFKDKEDEIQRINNEDEKL